MILWQTAIVFAAAFAAGLMNSVAGGGTLLTFPTLVWIGRDPIIANATNTVALWPGSLAGMVGFRRELRAGGGALLPLVVPSLLGGVTGACLLLRTPSRTFAEIVPYLILFATVLFATQEPLTRRLRRRTDAPRRVATAAAAAGHVPGVKSAVLHQGGGAGTLTTTWWAGAVVFQFLVAVYGGYFGAGIGILMLAALGLLGLTDIHHMNGLKNLFAVCINGIAAVYFGTWGAVGWADAAVMAAGAIAGGYGGAGLARRLGRRFVRRAVVVIGVAMAISLLLRHR
jgi:uncharacterized membrane protein YfcA